VSINSLHLTDLDIGFFDSRARLSPPLRQQRDRDALRAALRDGTIDALVSDHNPVDEDAKTLPFAEAEPGATGLELLLSLALKWSQDSGVPLQRALAVVTSEPARVLGTALGTLQASVGPGRGRRGRCVHRRSAVRTGLVQPAALRSQGKHTPFSGYELPGGCVARWSAGRWHSSASRQNEVKHWKRPPESPSAHPLSPDALAPLNHDSGKMRGKRSVWGGREVRFDPIKAFYVLAAQGCAGGLHAQNSLDSNAANRTLLGATLSTGKHCMSA
jgi:hypothetical protein